MSDQFDTSVDFSECFSCGKCCKSVEEGVVGYHAVKAVMDEKISEKDVKAYAIFHIHEEHLELLADYWVHYPSINIMREMTRPVDHIYEYLVMPAYPKGCAWLTPTGCKYPHYKNFDCRLFPFYFYKNNFCMNEGECPLLGKLNIPKLKALTQQTTDEYVRYSVENRDNYFRDVAIIKKKYKLPVVEMTPQKIAASGHSSIGEFYPDLC